MGALAGVRGFVADILRYGVPLGVLLTADARRGVVGLLALVGFVSSSVVSEEGMT